MANQVAKITLGIDVAKDQHLVYNWQTQHITRLPNRCSDIKAWLSTLHGPVRMAIEPTSHYHLVMVDEALELGHEVYLVNPRQLAHYRGSFAGSDAFVAYLGLDIRIRESGYFKGRRKLSKRGEPEVRRLLFCASQPARHYPSFAEYYQRQLDKGLSRIAARVILARKLARIAFTLMRNGETFVKEEKAIA